MPSPSQGYADPVPAVIWCPSGVSAGAGHLIFCVFLIKSLGVRRFPGCVSVRFYFLARDLLEASV